MRSRMVFQIGLGAALMVGAVTVTTAADMPSGEKDMVLIPKGEFTMGSSEHSDEAKHQVVLDAYSIDKFEASNARYKEFMKTTGHPVRDNAALTTFSVRPMGIDEAIRRALAHEETHFAATRWSDSLSSSGTQKSWGGVRFGTRIVDSRALTVEARPEVVFRCIERIGGDHGWYACNWLWRLRGSIDLLQGGVGMRRGRPSPTTLRVGDTVDSFRVEAIEPNRLLRLKSEMNLPGRAWLEFEVTAEDSSTQIRQTAIFDPVGLKGQLYWYSLYVPHEFVFNGMLRGIAQAALREMSDLDMPRTTNGQTATTQSG
ncbi:MAG: DUF2867 domain-containing protein [Nitrospira sp.]|nr:DUF2867 domain-containing protein [Nitrospira sp.]